MRRRLSPSAALLLCLSSTWSGVLAAAGSPGRELCSSACQAVTRYPVYEDVDPKTPRLDRECRSRLHVTSLYLCLRVYCHGDYQTDLITHFNNTCIEHVHAPLPPYSIVSTYTDDDISGLRHLELEETISFINLNEVIVPSERLFRLSSDTMDAWTYVSTYHYVYSAAMILFWIIVIIIAQSGRLLSVFGRGLKAKKDYQPLIGSDRLEYDEISTYKGAAGANRSWLWFKRYFTLPATFGYRCAQDFGWYTVPPRVQSLTILAFVIINIAFCIHGYHIFPDNMYWPKVSHQLYRYVSDRTGYMSFANFPLLWLFGIRNNVLMWLTGWDFKTFNNFHRWVARVATVEAVIHSVGYTILVFEEGGWQRFANYWKVMWWWTGELATIFMCLLIPLSLYWMRRNQYETFLILHIVLSLFVLAGMWGHVSIFNGEFNIILIPTTVIWVLDRVLRTGRVLAFNLKFWNTRAKATYNPKSKIVRVTVPYSTSFYQPKPGTFYYIHLLNDSHFWESHPFTVASTTARHSVLQRETGPTTQPDVPSSEEASGLLQENEEPPRSADSSSPFFPRLEDVNPERSTMTFLIRPYDSFTARLRDKAAATWPHPAGLRLLIDGPYGHTQSFDQFDSVLFIVGGSGIVVPMSHLENLCRPLARTKSVKIIWAVREAAFAADVLRQDIRDAAFEGGKLSLDVHITDEAVPADEEDRSSAGLPPRKEVRLLSGRPDVHVEVDCATADADGGRLAVVACGPAKMADDARKAVVSMLARGAGNVEYFEESFNW